MPTIFNEIEPYEHGSQWDEYHDVNTITIAELSEDGWFDLSNKEQWGFPQYSDEQHSKLCEKITAHFWLREISLVPPQVWKHEFLRKMNEIMPKYIPLYKIIAENPDGFAASSDYYKSRNIYSDFPQTQLSGANSDYASSGNDMEYERMRLGSVLDIAERLKSYQDIDLMIINEIEPLFSCMFTLNINAF